MNKNFSPGAEQTGKKAKRGRPKTGRTKRREYRLGDDDYARLQEAARAARLSVAEFTRRAVLQQIRGDRAAIAAGANQALGRIEQHVEHVHQAAGAVLLAAGTLCDWCRADGSPMRDALDELQQALGDPS